MKKCISFVLVMMLIIVLSVSSFSAADYGCNVETTSSAVYLENLNTGNVILEKNAEEKMYPASLTKIMTYIIVTENIPDLENTTITIKEEAFTGLDPESSVMGLKDHIGKAFPVIDLLYGMMVPSGNDAAYVLADYVGDGVIENFVDKMNRKAGQLGCKGTHFVNPHGLYDSNHYSTAKDMAIISKYALDKPHFMEIAGTSRYTVAGMNSTIVTTNYMIDQSYPQYYYPYITSGKTGYTDEAGKCLMTTAQKDDYKYLCIALGASYSVAEDINYAMLDTKELYTWSFDNISFTELMPENEVLKRLPVEFVWGNEMLNAVVEKGVTALLPKNYDKALVTTQVDLPDYVSAPIEKGEVLGSVKVLYDGEVVGTTNIVSPRDIERDQSNYLMHRFIGFVVNNIIVISIVLCILVIVIAVKISTHKNKKKRQSRYRYR